MSRADKLGDPTALSTNERGFPFCIPVIAQNDVDDVRDVLHYYRQFEDPISQFRENQRKLAEQMQEAERIEQAKTKPMVKQWSRGILGR